MEAGPNLIAVLNYRLLRIDDQSILPLKIWGDIISLLVLKTPLYNPNVIYDGFAKPLRNFMPLPIIKTLFQKLRSSEFQFWVLCVLVIFLPISKSVAETCVIILIVAKVLSWKPLQNPALWTSAGLFLIWLVICTAACPHQHLEVSIKGLWKWGRCLALLGIVYELFQQRSERSLKILLLVFLGSMLLVAVDGFYQFFDGRDFLRDVTMDPGRLPRIKASMSAPTHLAYFLTLTIPLVFFFLSDALQKKNRASALFHFSALALFVLLFLLTFSRAAFFALLLASLILLIRSAKFLRWLPALLVGLALFSLAPQVRYNFVQSIQTHDISLGERLKAWDTSLRMIRMHPVMGVGPNLYHTLIPVYADPVNPYRGYAHNSYLQLTAEAGIPGLLLFFAVLFFAVRAYFFSAAAQKVSPPTTPFLFCAWLAFLLQCLFDNHLFSIQPSLLFWLITGLLAAAANTYPQQRGVPSEQKIR